MPMSDAASSPNARHRISSVVFDPSRGGGWGRPVGGMARGRFKSTTWTYSLDSQNARASSGSVVAGIVFMFSLEPPRSDLAPRGNAFPADLPTVRRFLEEVPDERDHVVDAARDRDRGCPVVDVDHGADEVVSRLAHDGRRAVHPDQASDRQFADRPTGPVRRSDRDDLVVDLQPRGVIDEVDHHEVGDIASLDESRAEATVHDHRSARERPDLAVDAHSMPPTAAAAAHPAENVSAAPSQRPTLRTIDRPRSWTAWMRRA